MPSHTPRTQPDTIVLRALFDATVEEIGKERPSLNLVKGFYAETANSVFKAGCLALSDYCKGNDAPQRVHTVSAPAGGGKTTFAYALICAVARYADQSPGAPYGCVFVVDQIKKANDVHKDLSSLLPGKVAVWTSEQDKKRQDELRHYPVIVVTHNFYNGPRGHKAHGWVRDGHFHEPRALVVVDEKPEEVITYELTIREAQAAREALEDKRPDLQKPLEALLLFMTPYAFSLVGTNEIGRATDRYSQEFITEHLQWFTSEAASRIIVEHGQDIPCLDRLFGYARALTQGYAFVAASGPIVHYVGWQPKLIMRRGCGTILLDATADIDGVSQIAPGRALIEAPQARYDNLEIVHVPQHTRQRLKQYLSKATNQRAYVRWMEDVIREHVAPGERALVVCKKPLFDAERVPSWPEGDARFQTPELYTTQYGWEFEGRKLCATHWGNGIGRNDWQDAHVVLLFDEFFIPRRVAVTTVQGLREHRANQGALGSMTTLNSKSRPVDVIAEGHRLRFTKQMALRGGGRHYDERGVCGKQRLVVSSDLKSFMANADKLFPGATIRTAGVYAEGHTWTHRIIELLSKSNLPDKITTKQISAAVKKPWRSFSRNVLTPEFQRAAKALGWQYINTKGRGGSWFQRVGPVATQGA